MRISSLTLRAAWDSYTQRWTLLSHEGLSEVQICLNWKLDLPSPCSRWRVWSWAGWKDKKNHSIYRLTILQNQLIKIVHYPINHFFFHYTVVSWRMNVGMLHGCGGADSPKLQPTFAMLTSQFTFRLRIKSKRKEMKQNKNKTKQKTKKNEFNATKNKSRLSIKLVDQIHAFYLLNEQYRLNLTLSFAILHFLLNKRAYNFDSFLPYVMWHLLHSVWIRNGEETNS